MIVRLLNFHCIVRYSDPINHSAKYCFVAMAQINAENFGDVIDLVVLQNT